MDTLCCQTYYNPAIIIVLNLFLLGLENKLEKTKEVFDKSIKNSNLFSMNVP